MIFFNPSVLQSYCILIINPKSERTHPHLRTRKKDINPHLVHTNKQQCPIHSRSRQPCEDPITNTSRKQGNKEDPSPGATTLERELIPGTPQAHPNNVQTTIRGKRETPITEDTTHDAPVPTMIMIGSSEDDSQNEVEEITVREDQSKVSNPLSGTQNWSTNFQVCQGAWG